MDCRLLLAVAYLSHVAIAVCDQTDGQFKLLQAASAYSPTRPVWPIRFTHGHFDPGTIVDHESVLALVVSVQLRPWSLQVCSIQPGGMNNSPARPSFEAWDIATLGEVPTPFDEEVRVARRHVQFSLDIAESDCADSHVARYSTSGEGLTLRSVLRALHVL
eukprot:6475448-Amphidinium_carterae.1